MALSWSFFGLLVVVLNAVFALRLGRSELGDQAALYVPHVVFSVLGLVALAGGLGHLRGLRVAATALKITAALVLLYAASFFLFHGPADTGAASTMVVLLISALAVCTFFVLRSKGAAS